MYTSNSLTCMQLICDLFIASSELQSVGLLADHGRKSGLIITRKFGKKSIILMKDVTITYTMMLLCNWSLIKNLCQFSISSSCVPSHMSRTSFGSYMTTECPIFWNTRVYITWKCPTLLFFDPDQNFSVVPDLSFHI